MPKTLQRVLRLRRLQEETIRIELEAESRQLRRVERARDAANQEAFASRRGAFSSLGGGDVQAWLLEEAALEFAAWQAEDLARLEAQQAHRVEELRTAFLECRKATGQVEVLLKSYEEQLRIEQGRREQAALDEWFNLQRRRIESARGRRNPHPDAPGNPENLLA